MNTHTRRKKMHNNDNNNTKHIIQYKVQTTTHTHTVDRAPRYNECRTPAPHPNS
jgi:hypothetical protein